VARFIATQSNRRIAYERTEGRSPGVVFLGGLRSDMQGTKALYLQDAMRKAGHGFLRFDYSGHGESSGSFVDGSIGDWFTDAECVLQKLTEGPQILVGSSMGGWISLLLARMLPQKVAGLVTIAAAPDFTEDSMWDAFDVTQRATLHATGQVSLPSDYGEPYVITKRMIEDGRDNLVLRSPLKLPFPVRFLQGTADKDVDPEVAQRLLDHATGPDIRLTLVKDADHRFSDPKCLKLITDTVQSVLREMG